MQYVDIHLSHVAQHVVRLPRHLDVAVIEVAGILPDGRLIPSTSVGNNKTWLEQADKIILEVNSAQPAELEGMHDIYYGRPCRQAQAHTHGAPVRPHWRALSALRPEQGDRRGANDQRDRLAAFTHPMRLHAHCREHHRLCSTR
jgi:succinyl-CoA:acetate CoA-transferase